MIIDCISDLHGHYPDLEGGDLLIVAGDLTAHDDPHERHAFLHWFAEQEYKKKMWIAGNHDNSLDGLTFGKTRPDAAEYLCDSGTEFEGLKIWGSPWTPWFHGVNPDCAAFMLPEQELAKKWDLIPDDIDILITHGPPHGILDVNMYDVHCGSKSLRARVDKINPKLHVFGHIHEEGGHTYRYQCPHEGRDTTFVNASLMDEWYKPVNKRVRVEI